jgi:Outer membrane protein beta-barrel domain
MSRQPAVALALLLLCGARAAAADAARPRDGFIIGFGVGFGATYPCDTCPSFAGSFYVGAMTSKNVAIVGDFAVVGGDVDRPPAQLGSSRGLGLGTFALAVQVWPHDRFWLKAGVGIGAPVDTSDSWDDDFDTSSDRSWAGIVGAGYEVAHKGRFVMDVQVRGAFISDHQAVSLGLGFNW